MILKSIFATLFFAIVVWANEARIFPTANFRTPKNVAFASIGGGQSHHLWVFEVLTEMNSRGHNVSFYSRGDQLPFAKNYPMIKQNQIGNYPQLLASPSVVKAIMSNPKDHSVLTLAVIEAAMLYYPSELKELQAYFSRDEIDLVLCDAFFVACVDAGILANKPVAITFTFGGYSDFAAPYIHNKVYDSVHPTTETESIWRRAYDAYIKYPYHRRRIAKSMKEAHALQRSLGLKPTLDTHDERYRDTLKLINNVYGIELARPASPMVQMIGPVMPKSFPALDDETLEFLNDRSKVCYIGFGQFALASPLHSEYLLRAVLELREQGHVDGVIWGRVAIDQLPLSVQVGNTTWTKEDLLNHPDIRFMDWAPQFGILQHPSTSFFISHGGIGSMHEALHNNVRIFVFPFFGDQPGNARGIERTGFGRFINKDFMTFDEAGYQLLYEKMYQVAVDPTGEIQTNVDRFSAHVQINAATSIARTSDLLEEQLFASNEKGVLFHRRSVGYDIHWIKRNNIDIFALAATIVLGSLFSLNVLYTTLFKNNLNTKLKQA